MAERKKSAEFSKYAEKLQGRKIWLRKRNVCKAVGAFC